MTIETNNAEAKILNGTEMIENTEGGGIDRENSGIQIGTKNVVVNITTRLFSQNDGLFHALGDEKFSKLSSSEQVEKLGKLFREHVSGNKELSAQLMRMIRGATVFASGNRALSEDELMKVSPSDLELLGKLSRKKVVLARLKIVIGKYYDTFPYERKDDFTSSGMDRDKYIETQIRDIYRQFAGISSDIIDSLWNNYGLSFEVRMFLKIFYTEDLDSDDTFIDTCNEEGTSPEFLMELGVRLPYLGINTNKIRKEIMYQSDELERLTGNYLERGDQVTETSIDSRNGFINPNWFLYDIDVDNAIKLWGVEKTKYIFGRYFRTGIENMKIAKDVLFPEFYNFSLFRIKIDSDAEGNKKKLVEMAQHITEWTLPNDFSQKDFSQLIGSLRSVISDFRSSGEPKKFDHPIQTSLGMKKYHGYFSGSKGFENTHIIQIQPTAINGKKTLRFTTEMGQDTMLFITIQISYFLKHKKSIPSHILWREVYEMYNRLSLEGVEKFDPSSMKTQYDTLVQKLVWPLSLEHKKEKGIIGKAHNTLLYGIYGTGKSQLLTHLLSEREFHLKNGKNIHLEANVINIGIMEFADLLVKSISTFRKRLSDIHENTGRPIILVIEDIDTIVAEVGLDSDPVSQAMTTLFEGVGSLPVTVVASTNNPEKLPQRHLRPNRLDTVIAFPYPLDEKALGEILYTHLEKKGLDKVLEGIISCKEIGEIVLPKIKHFTPSHISALCLSIYEALEFENMTTLSVDSVKDILNKELTESLVPVKDMQSREQAMKKWKESLGSNGTKVGFM